MAIVTGFVVDLKQLKDVMHSQVVDVYDHRHLNLEIPEFRDRVPTVENIAVSAWERLVADNPVLAALQPDVEALLVNRMEGAREHYRVPIDPAFDK